jgi:hypothetical protein
MESEDLVVREFAQLSKELGITFDAPVRDSWGMEGRLTLSTGLAFCAADWWDRGGVFTLFLGRYFEVEGLPFYSEFPVADLKNDDVRVPYTWKNELEDRIRRQFEILRLRGGSWLKGDFSCEPYIRHKVLPRRNEPNQSPDPTFASGTPAAKQPECLP